MVFLSSDDDGKGRVQVEYESCVERKGAAEVGEVGRYT